MNLELHDFNNLPALLQEDVAEHVSAYTNGKAGEQPQMLPLSPEAILSKHMGIVAFSDDTFAGYIGAAIPENHNGVMMPEVGSLWVPETFRKQGIAHKLVKIISGKLIAIDELPYAFCNPLSSTIFTNLGYSRAAVEEVPSVAFTLCMDCPKKPASGCCDTVFVFRGTK